MSSRAQRAKEVFEEAVELPKEQRLELLAEACRDDAELRADVERLLRAYDQAGSFLAELPIEGEQAGTAIGRYKLLQEIGRGGFGVVWLAEQTEPVRRRVALKIIKLGMDTRQVIARFEAERQALALMDHPNIAKVLDGGATATGRPYFVMELVRGVPITEFCDRAGLGVPQRLALFRQVCQAVQHAHHKGVIHRDLKPNNILVVEQDGTPVPKVIDFGIAKATAQELTQRTLFTDLKQIVGTPEYMAPEQAQLLPLDVDTRADVYSLGVLLYELLTGTRPFELGQGGEHGYLDVLRQVREVDPPRPSTRIGTLGARLAAVVEERRTDPGHLVRLLRGDLDWIVMRALEKDRSRRYATAQDLAADLDRHLRNLPIEAGPPRLSYRLAKLVRRNRVLVAAAAVTLLALGGGLAATLVAWQRAVDAESRSREQATRADGEARAARAAEAQERTAKETALAAERRAREQAERADVVIRLVKRMLTAANPHDLRGPGFTVRELLDEFDRGLGKQLAKQPDVEATVRTIVGAGYRTLGLFDKAERHLEAALEAFRRSDGDNTHREADILWHLAWLWHDQGNYARARRGMQKALELVQSQALLGSRLESDIRSALGDIERHLGNLEAAEQQARKALAIPHGESTRDAVAEALNLNILAMVLQARGKYEEAETLYRQALDQFRALQGDDSPTAGMSLHNLATLLFEQRRFAESEQTYRESAAAKRRSLGETHPGLVLTLIGLSLAQRATGQHEPALQTAVEAVRVARQTRGHVEPTQMASALETQARALLSLSRPAEAETVLREALAVRVEAMPDNWLRYQATSLLGEAVAAQQRWAEAEPILVEGYEKMPLAATHIRRRDALARLVRFYEAWNAAEPDAARAERAERWRALLTEHSPAKDGAPPDEKDDDK